MGSPAAPGPGLLQSGLIGQSAEAQKNQAAKGESKERDKDNTVQGTNELLTDIYSVMATAWGK